MDRIIAALGPLSPVAGREERWTLAERMALHKVPGLSVAIIDDGRVVEAAGFGLADVSTGAAVMPETLFQACSMSKPVAALAVMRAVERGQLSLDGPVNTYLRSWTLPSSDAFDAGAVTLGRLLDHTAGTSVPGFGGYPAGTAIPTTVQVLEGAPPANSEPVRITAPPGGQERYSGGGTTIAQLVLEELWDLPAPEIYRREVLEPLGMAASTFAQPLPAALAAGAASGHDDTGAPVPGRCHVYPEYAAAGLWTTAADYARFLIAIQEALAGRPGAILSRAAARRFVTPQPGSTHGAGPEVSGAGERMMFGHSGGNRGFRCDSRAYGTGGKGAVVLVNGEGARNAGWALTRELMTVIARVYDWPGFARAPRAPVRLSQAELAALCGRYALGEMVVTVDVADGELISTSSFAGARRLLALSPTQFFATDSAYDLSFDVADGIGRAFVIQDGASILARLPREEG